MTNTDQQTTTATEEPEETTAGPFDGLKGAVRGLGKTVVDAGFHRVGGLTDKLTTKLGDFAEGKKEQAEQADAPGPVANAVKEAVVAKVEGENPAMAAIKGALGGVKNKLTGGGKGGKGGKQKFTNIVEWIDVGVPVRVAYNQWTEFESWPGFMKKVENVQRNEEQGKLAFKAQVFLLHRSWEQNIIEMVPDDHIVWQSTGQKGYINGGVTFHEVGDPPMTRICVVLEYHPQGVLEKTLNIWRAVGRASRRELKRYVRQVQTHTILAPDEVQGWRAEVRDKKIVRTHDEVVEQEQREAEEAEAAEAAEQEGDEEEPQGAEGEYAEGEYGEGEYGEDEYGEAEGEPEAGASEEEAEAAEDATYLDEAGIGQEEQPAAEGEDEYAEDESAEGEYPEDESSEDEESAEGSDESESEGEDEGDEGAEDEYEDEESDEGAEDEYEDEESDEGAEDEYEDEGEGSEDEYESEDEGAEGERSDEPGADASGDGTGESSSGTPTPKDVASGSVHPTESPRPRRRQPA